MTSEKGEKYVKVGACGSTDEPGYQKWDDGFHLAIRHIYVCYSEKSVNSIQVAYLNLVKGSILSPKHGNTDSTDFFEEINISPNDLIISVSGCCSNEKVGFNSISQLLTSLKFETASGKTYGPYGINDSERIFNSFTMQKNNGNNSFCFKTASGVMGFHGSTNGSRLASIGIYVE